MARIVVPVDIGSTDTEPIDIELGELSPPLSGNVPEPDERQLREERILDTATALLVRWGYRKTTIDDVAREAGVGKGTIYLHWKDKNELFSAAVAREQRRFTADIQQRVAADPDGGLLHRLTAHSFVAALSNPLMAAVIKGQSDIFNGVLGSYSQDTLNQMISGLDTYIIQLQQAGLIRNDLSVPVISFLMMALKIGVINAPDMIGQKNTPSIDEMADALSDMIRRWLEPEALPADSEVGKRAFTELLDNSLPATPLSS